MAQEALTLVQFSQESTAVGSSMRSPALLFSSFHLTPPVQLFQLWLVTPQQGLFITSISLMISTQGMSTQSMIQRSWQQIETNSKILRVPLDGSGISENSPRLMATSGRTHMNTSQEATLLYLKAPPGLRLNGTTWLVTNCLALLKPHGSSHSKVLKPDLRAYS